MVLPVIGRVSLRSLGIGAAVSVVGAAVARPLLVETLRIGYEATGFVRNSWQQAKAEAASVRAEALAGRSPAANDEVQRLREEVAALRAQQTSTRKTAS